MEILSPASCARSCSLLKTPPPFHFEMNPYTPTTPTLPLENYPRVLFASKFFKGPGKG